VSLIAYSIRDSIVWSYDDHPDIAIFEEMVSPFWGLCSSMGYQTPWCCEQTKIVHVNEDCYFLPLTLHHSSCLCPPTDKFHGYQQ